MIFTLKSILLWIEFRVRIFYVFLCFFFFKWSKLQKKKKLTGPELSHSFREISIAKAVSGFFAAGFLVMKADMYIYKQKILFAYMFIFVCMLSL